MTGSRIFGYLVRSALLSLRTSWLLQTVTIATIATTFTILAGVYLMIDNVRSAFISSRGGVHISVYFQNGGESKSRAAVEKNFCTRDFVAACEFRSMDAAKERFLEDNPGLEEAVASMNENPFPASMELEIQSKFRNTALLGAFSKGLAGLEGVQAVDDGGEWTSQWISFLNLLDGALWVLTATLGLATIFIVSNTIRLVVFSRRDEVEILNLVGATDFFIRVPFIIEGILQGIVGSLLSLGALHLLMRFLMKVGKVELGGFLTGSIHFLDLQSQVALIVFGIGVGLLGSLVAVGRHLRT